MNEWIYIYSRTAWLTILLCYNAADFLILHVKMLAKLMSNFEPQIWGSINKTSTELVPCYIYAKFDIQIPQFIIALRNIVLALSSTIVQPKSVSPKLFCINFVISFCQMHPLIGWYNINVDILAMSCIVEAIFWKVCFFEICFLLDLPKHVNTGLLLKEIAVIQV